jgi:predicted kinase
MISDAAIRILLSQGKSVILNGVNLQKMVRREYILTAKECGAKTQIVFLDVTLAECQKRNELTEKLPSDRLFHFAGGIEPPEKEEADELIVVKDSRAAPEKYWEYHHKNCGTRYRGCDPSACPSNQYQETGIWKRNWES